MNSIALELLLSRTGIKNKLEDFQNRDIYPINLLGLTYS